MGQTKIEWAEAVWNPVTGCTKISPGCQNCYAERMSKRLAGRCGYPKDDPFRVTLHPEKLDEPLRWKKPRRVFVCSMGDLFHEDVPESFFIAVYVTMESCPQHTFLLLTKRPERAAWLLNKFTGRTWPLPNVWLGVTAENQEQADKRITILLQIPAAVRFVSVEPMLGPVDLTRIGGDRFGWFRFDALNGLHYIRANATESGCEWETDLCAKLDWVICGCESGPHRRSADINCIRSLRDQCVAAGTKFFLKQMEIDGKLVKMPELDGRTWDEYPEVR